MRILLISNVFPPGFIGGYELGAFDIARGLIERGHTLAVLTSDQLTDDSGILAFPVHRVLQFGILTRSEVDRAALNATQAFLISANVRHLVTTLIAFRPDRVLCFNLAFMGGPGVLACLAAIGYRPVIYMMDSAFESYVSDTGGRAIYENCFGEPHWLERTEAIFMSNNLRREVQRKLPLAEAAIVPGWFHPELILPQSSRDPERPDGPARFIFASRVMENKGINLLLAAARLLLDGGADDFTVDIVGNGEVAPMLHQISALGLRRHFHYRGVMPKEMLQGRFSDYDALVLPTLPREPFAFVVAEAAAAGCIPIVTAGIGASEWFLDGVDSFKTRRTADGVATAMLRVMGMPSDERDAMRGRSRRTAERFFKFDTALTAVEAVLKRAEPAASLSEVTPASMRAVGASLEVLTGVWRRHHHG